MERLDELADIIENIDVKIQEIDKQMIKVEEIESNFGAMDTFIPELESAYKEFVSALSNGIITTKAINKIVLNDAIHEYNDIYHDLETKYKKIIHELLETISILKTEPVVTGIPKIDSTLEVTQEITPQQDETPIPEASQEIEL